MNETEPPKVLEYEGTPPKRKRASLLTLVAIAVVGSAVIEVLDHGPVIVRAVRGIFIK